MKRPQDAVLYDDLDHLPLGVMAKHVRGAAFQQMVRDASMGDARMLEALREAGRFEIEPRDVLESALSINPILSFDAIQVVDSLASVLLPFKLQYKHEPSLGAAPTGSAKTWHCKLEVDDAVQDLVKKVFHDVLDDLAAFEASDHDFVSASEEDDAGMCIRASRGVIAAVACAMDDVSLLKRCLSADQGKSLDTRLKTHTHFTNVADVEFLPSGFAVLFGSVNCIRELGVQSVEHLKTVAINPKFDASDDARSWNPLLLATHVSNQGAPRNAVLGAILDGLQEADGSYAGDVARWLPGQALSMLGRGNPQILGVLLDHGVAEIDLDVTRRVAFEFALPELAARFLEKAPDSVFPRLEDGPEGSRWFSGDHPVVSMISNFDAPKAQVDAALAMVIDAMASRGLISDLIEARDASEVTFAEHLVYDERPASMAAMLANGLDPLMRTGGRDNLSLLEFAEAEQRNAPGPFVNMMRAAVARNAAMLALECIEDEVFSSSHRKSL